MSNSKEGEGPKIIDMNLDSSKVPAPKPLTDAQRMQQEKVQRKQASVELADYMKRLRTSNEMKEMQVHELELGVAYYHAKKAFRDLQPEIEALDAIEQAEMKEMEAERKKAHDDYLKIQNELAEKKKKDEKPKIIKSGGGVPRSKQ